MPDQGSGSALQKLEANGLAAASILLRLAILHIKNPIEYILLSPVYKHHFNIPPVALLQPTSYSNCDIADYLISLWRDADGVISQSHSSSEKQEPRFLHCQPAAFYPTIARIVLHEHHSIAVLSQAAGNGHHVPFPGTFLPCDMTVGRLTVNL